MNSGKSGILSPVKAAEKEYQSPGRPISLKARHAFFRRADSLLRQLAHLTCPR